MHDDLKVILGRDPKDSEIINMETDTGMLVRLLMARVDDLEDKVAILIKK